MKKILVAVNMLAFTSSLWGQVLSSNGLYHNHPAPDPLIETLPHPPLSSNTFLELNYTQSTACIYFLTDNPAGSGTVATGVRLFTVAPGIGFESIENAEFVANVVLTPSNQFHATPTSGTNVLDLWKATWCHPHGYTRTVSYAPFITLNVGPRTLCFMPLSSRPLWERLRRKLKRNSNG